MAKLPNPKPWKFSGRLIVTLGSALFLFLLVPAVSFRRTSKLSQVLQAVAAHTVETSCLSTASPVPGAVQPVGLADSLWPRGQVHKVIYDQHLSLWAFHDLKGQILQGLLEHISDDTAAKHTVVICGLEYGEEAELYASEGFKTVVFEPLAAWADKFLERITDDVAKRVVLHKVGAAVQRRYGVLEYQGKSENVIFDPLDSHVAEHVLLLALDTQGSEYEILLGAENLLTKHGVDILEIEIVAEDRDPSGGPPHITKMLEMLDRLGYILFDFAWWGSKYNGTGVDCPPDARKDAAPHCYYASPRPSSISEYVGHMHEVQRQRFNWMQTDILAIRRDCFHRDGLVGFIENLSDLCTENICAMRKVMGELKD